MSAGSEYCVAEGVGTENDILVDDDGADDKADEDADLGAWAADDDDDDAADLVFWAGPITCCKLRVGVSVLGNA